MALRAAPDVVLSACARISVARPLAVAFDAGPAASSGGPLDSFVKRDRLELHGRLGVRNHRRLDEVGRRGQREQIPQGNPARG